MSGAETDGVKVGEPARAVSGSGEGERARAVLSSSGQVVIGAR
jgi:hypothetical protein